MNTIPTPTEYPSGTWEVRPDEIIAPHFMQSTEAFKQQSSRCALATTDLSASLALAAMICIDAGAIAMDAALELLMSSVAAAEMASAYTDLADDRSPADMYEVQYAAEPIVTTLPQAPFSFETVLKNFTTNLLQLNITLHLVHLSYKRLQATLEALEHNQHDPAGALYQDALLFSTLQRQALWRNLKLCVMLHHDLLLLTPCVNLLWCQFRLRVPSQSLFQEQNVREMLTDLWKERTQDIATYNLNTFGITTNATMLHILAQPERALTDPVLLVQEVWHKSVYLLTQSFHHALDTFYTGDKPRSLETAEPAGKGDGKDVSSQEVTV